MALSVTLIILCTLLSQFCMNVDGLSCTPRPPEQIRVAIQDETSVTVSWKTYGYSNGSNDTPQPVVQYNTDGNFSRFYLNSSEGVSSIYDKLHSISWFHDCLLHINTSKTYYYRIPASGECVNMSETYYFTTQPPAGDTSPINITIFGDLGYDTKDNQNASSKTIAGLIGAINTSSFYLHVGDISYADEEGIPKSIVKNYEMRWDSFQRRIQPITAEKFYMTAPGNHEVTCTQSFDYICTRGLPNATHLVNITKQYRNFNAYLHRFHMPGGVGHSNGSYRNLWYSFNYGLAHIIVINTETDFHDAPSGPGKALNGKNFAPKGTQINWLIQDLQNATENRRKVPWIIVAGHRPFFGSDPELPALSNNCRECRDAFAKIIFRFDVDFYFCGHVHWYERLFPVNKHGLSPLDKHSYINQTGPIYVTTGAGGNPEKAQNIGLKAYASAYNESSYGYSQLEIQDDTHSRLKFYNTVNNKINSVDIVRLRRH